MRRRRRKRRSVSALLLPIAALLTVTSVVIVFLWNKESVPVQEKMAAVKEEPSVEMTQLKSEPEKANKVTETAIKGRLLKRLPKMVYLIL